MSRFASSRVLAGALGLAMLAVALAPAASRAADPPAPGPWKYKTVLGVNLAQSAFSSNWRGGDKGQFTWVASADVGAERQFSERFALANTLKLAYGQTGKQVAGSTWETPSKSTDQILFESVGRFTLSGFVDPYLALNVESQFLDQSNPAKDLTFNPVKVKESAGIARTWVKTEERELLSRLGFGFRQTFARSISDPLTLEEERFTSNDGGVEFVTTTTWPLLEKRVLYKARLTAFQPVFYSKSDALEEYDALAVAADPTHESVADFWKTTDLDFESTFTAPITKHLNVNLLVQWVYDKFDVAANVDPTLPLAVLNAEIAKNTRKAGQFREVLAIGFTYSLF